MHIIQSPLFDFEAFIRTENNDRLVIVLEALDAEKLLVALERVSFGWDVDASKTGLDNLAER